ncbi:Integrins alpha chain [Nitrosococcus oceani ATCC 19707]|uniref:Integrins alpha chain n=2 Tax=Nitrosococcus oceani TaxID=1229 RepID=Q3J9E3_NITOC|nr:integrin alpha [Nitrosococcus oceani]ABA58553.1 Integrins alpha chain [Nitrosococcus oceani ATCC 19707]EDZ68551.1 FG-GAP repeat domain protein [Nitrosococcus oceani AFC27]KFI19005.1 integrin [Nitrosococcus oceani C-27]GEM19672.1 hypothetical protein NONS58_10660 [Nitrosococcus oceani]
MSNKKATFISRAFSSPSDSKSSAQIPRALAPRPLAVALRRVLGGGLLAVGLVGPALGQTPGLELSDLDGSNGFIINGIAAFDDSGQSVSGAEDVNGDGFDDLVIGAPDASPNGVSGAGQSYVVFGTGGDFPAAVELSALDGSNGFVLNGIAAFDDSGQSVSGAGDVNGDGLDDLVIGAPAISSRFAPPFGPPHGGGSGQSYVVFGTGEGFPPVLELSALDGSNGFTLNGSAAYDNAGFSVSGAGDVNGDGLDDLVINAPGASPNGDYSGQSYVVFGTGEGFPPVLELSALDGGNGFIINGVAAADHSGRSVSGAGDVNGDGLDDIVIGAPDASPNGANGAGQSYVVFGTGGGFPPVLELAALDGSNGFALNGIAAGDRSGSSVSGAGDVNGDGLDDIVIGARFASPNGVDRVGQSYVVFGTSGGFPAVLELSALDGGNGFALNGSATYDNAGFSVSGAEDVNGDGVDDILIGAPFASPNGIDYSGQSYVVFGTSGGFPAALELSALDGRNGFALNGGAASDLSGRSVSGVGDVNGDGFDDIVIGAPYADPNSASFAGQSYVVFGTDGGFPSAVELSALDGSNGFALNGIASGDFSGDSVSGAGDVNGDGFDDLVIGAPGADPNGDYSSQGQSYVVFGTPAAFSLGPAALFKGLLADVGALGLPAGLEHWLTERCGDIFNGSGLCRGSRSFQGPKPTLPPRGF